MTNFLTTLEPNKSLAFYEAARDILTDHGPSRDPMALRPSPSIVFIPVSVGSGREKTSGGHTIVTKWVDKLNADPLDKTFFGIIDRDVANTTRDRVHVLGRYSFENYLLDPLNLFCLLSEEGIAPSIPGVQISSGDEHVLRLQSDDALQAIANGVTAGMETVAPHLATSATSIVTYTVGKRITVPSWVINHRGHDLLQIAQAAFCNPRVINVPRLIKALRRGRLVPTELVKTLAEIQRA